MRFKVPFERDMVKFTFLSRDSMNFLSKTFSFDMNSGTLLDLTVEHNRQQEKQDEKFCHD